MPAKPAPSAKPPGLAVADSTVESQDSELAAAGRELAEDMAASGADESASPAERRAAERATLRRQRADARDVPSHRESRVPRSRVLAPGGASALRYSLPAPLIAVVAGGLLGVILGALSVGGWVIGLLVAGLTVMLLPALGWHPRSTRTGAE